MAPTTGFLPESFRLSSPLGIAVSTGLFLSLVTLYRVAVAVYNVWFHPLKHIPGPILARATGIPYTIHTRNGSMIAWLQELHAKYGEAVRVAPGEISFTSAESAWQDIYGFHVGKKKTGAYLKDRTWFPKPFNNTYSIIASDEEAHSRMRRSVAHAFSDKALREQQDIIQGYVDLLVSRLGEEIDAGKEAVDMCRWYNYATFDIIADLTFGEPLYCLRDRGYHPWVTMVYASVKGIGILACRNKYPIWDYYDRIKNIFKDTRAVNRARADFFALAKEKTTERIETEKDRPDFMSYILKNQGVEGKSISRGEMDSNSVIFLAAGSETTATLLSGVTYLLLREPEKYAKLVHEIRSTFTHYSDINIEEVNKMDYLIACLQEGLRYYPPVPSGFPRVVPKGGDIISGRYIPEGTAVYVSQHATNHSPRNYTDPDDFVPERWLGEERYKDDKREGLNPFSFGPRNCLGKNLAYAEMRLILAKMLFSYDLELADKQTNWLKQKVFTLWEKPPLMVKLRPVKR